MRLANQTHDAACRTPYRNYRCVGLGSAETCGKGRGDVSRGSRNVLPRITRTPPPIPTPTPTPTLALALALTLTRRAAGRRALPRVHPSLRGRRGWVSPWSDPTYPLRYSHLPPPTLGTQSTPCRYSRCELDLPCGLHFGMAGKDVVAWLGLGIGLG